MKSSAYVFFRLSRGEVFLDNDCEHDFSDNDPLQCNPAKYMKQFQDIISGGGGHSCDAKREIF